jgi:CRISPR type I-E-associated protein CasB/Cse2
VSEQSFKRDFEKIGNICREWWVELAAIDEKTGEEKVGGIAHRGELANLRRIGIDRLASDDRMDITEAVQLWRYWRLHGELAFAKAAHFRGANADDEFRQAVAVVASTLARVRKESVERKGQKVARLLGLGKDGKPVKDEEDAGARVMAEARFKRLIRTHDWPGLLDHGRRIVNLLGRDVPVADLGASLLLWNAGSFVIRRWSFAYYDADFADRDPNGADPDGADSDTGEAAAA